MSNAPTAHDYHRLVTDLGDDRTQWEEVFQEGIKTPKEYAEFLTYCDLFYAYAKKSPCHIRRGYEQGFIARTAKYKNETGSYYPACFPGLLERHLDSDPGRPFWVALRFGKKSRVKCLDFDNKDNVLGYYRDRGQFRPVARVPVTHFILMKRLYDAFPGHVWCVSSATLGLHVWEKFVAPRDAATVERLTRPRLTAIGFGSIEVYPSPSLTNQVLRRPFGLDYYTVSANGLIADWRDQTNFFVSANPAPPFSTIVTCLLDLARLAWDRCGEAGGFRASRTTEFAAGKRLNRRRLDDEAAEVVAWLEAGCPDEAPSVTSMASSSIVPSPAGLQARQLAPASMGPERGRPPQPVVITPAAVRQTSVRVPQTRWSWKKVVELARGGVPEENRLFEYLLVLARPLVWRDYYDLDAAERVRRVEADLIVWVETKNNGRVTRIQQGDWTSIKHEIRRQVRVAQEETTASLQQFYARMRDRDAAHPGRVQRIADIIRGTETPLSTPVCCRRINKEPDDTPLPPTIQSTLLDVVRAHNMRRRSGEYPFLRFARRFLNCLWEKSGVAQLHRDTLFEFCGSKNPNQLVSYKMILVRRGFISDQWEAHVRPGASAAVYEMTGKAFESFQTHNGTTRSKAEIPPTYLITPRAYEKLNDVGWGWE